MNRTINAILISPADDVVTIIDDIAPGGVAKFMKGDALAEITVTDNVPKYQKVAIQNISNGSVVRKYGEVIGVATQDIARGSHVHMHNIASQPLAVSKGRA